MESKASALAYQSKAEALDSSRPLPRLAGTMINASPCSHTSGLSRSLIGWKGMSDSAQLQLECGRQGGHIAV